MSDYKSDFDDFAGLTATLESRQTKSSGVPEWPADKMIPPHFTQWVKGLVDNPGKRQRITVNATTNIPLMHAGLKKVAAELAPELELHGRPRKDKQGNIIEFGISLGEKRGRKSAE